MYDVAVEALVQAQLRGVPQIKGNRAGRRRGHRAERCGLGCVMEAVDGSPWSDAYHKAGLAYTVITEPCPVGCGKRLHGSVHIVTHLNDDHAFDFIKIARILEAENAVNPQPRSGS
jgi:hypothetical protein